jgi:hypothetical protein
MKIDFFASFITEFQQLFGLSFEFDSKIKKYVAAFPV